MSAAYRNKVSRRDFLKMGGAGLAGAALLGTSACGGGSSSSELTFMFWGSSLEKEAITGMIEDFQDSHPEIGVDGQYIANTQYDAKINSLIAADNAPDIAYMNTGMAGRLAEQGRLVNLEDHFDDFPQLSERLPQSYFYWAEGSATNTLALATMNIWYDKDAFREAGVDFPPADAAEAWSWDEFVEAALRLTVDQEGRRASESGFDPENIQRYGVWLPSVFGQIWYPMLISNGGAVTSEDGARYELDSPESVEVFQRLQDLMHEHHVTPGLAQRQGAAPTSIVQLQSKRAAMVIDGQWVLLDLGQSGLDYGVGVLPKFQEPRTTVGGAPAAIFQSTGNINQALELYLYYNDPQNVNLFANGLWMPLEEKYYTEEKFINMWTDNEVHPPEYNQASIDYLLNYGESDLSVRLKNLDAINTKLEPALDPIWSGKQPAREVLSDLKGEIEPLLQGLYPAPPA